MEDGSQAVEIYYKASRITLKISTFLISNET